MEREALETIGQDISDNIPRNIIDRGISYFKKGRVGNLQTEREGGLAGQVFGSHAYSVHLDPHNFAKSWCSCPYTYACKHMVAVFCQAYSSFGNPRTYLTSPIPRPSGRAKSLQAPIMQDIPTPAAHDEPGQWLTYFDTLLGQNPDLDPGLEAWTMVARVEKYAKALREVSDRWPTNPQMLYQMYLAVYVRGALTEWLKRNIMLQYYLPPSSNVTNSLEVILTAVDNVSSIDATDARWLALARYVRQQLFTYQDPALFDFYLVLWGRMLGPFMSYDREIEALETIKEASSLRSGLLMLLYLLSDQDDRALAIVQKGWKGKTGQSAVDLPYVVTVILKILQGHHDPARLSRWLETLSKQVTPDQSTVFNLVCQMWLPLVKDYPDSLDVYGDYLRKYLPQTDHYYQEYLVMTRDYKTWVERHMVAWLSPFDVPQDQLRSVAAENPAILLPMYHQSVQRLVAEKNRRAYKMAITLLVKLRIHYKTLKRQQEWQDFIATFAKTHARLRALQEELVNRKLI